MKNHLLLGLIAILALPACKKTATPAPGTTNVKIDTDIYIGGSYAAKNGNEVAAYWKNGVITKLSDSTKNTYTTGIAVDGSDVYLAGYYYNSTQTIFTPAYWKNDNSHETRITLPDTVNSGETSGIAIYNHTVYVAGQIDKTNTYPVYWQANNAPVQLSQNNLSAAKAIAANQAGVYIAGYHSFDQVYLSVYWNNNALLYKPKDLLLPSEAQAVALNGTDIYTAGKTTMAGHSVATHWRNGNAVYLTDGSFDSYATGIAIKNNVVYTAGYRKTANGKKVACYWKDSIETDLTDYTQDVYVSGIALAGNDIYVSGIDNVNHKAVYWKNGNMHALPGGFSTTGIVVVTHPH